jgi:hypothetical protein
MGAFARFKNARSAMGAIRRFEVGNYRCSIKSVKFDKTRKGEEFFAVEFEIKEARAGEMKEGEIVNWGTFSSWDSYESQVKDFVCKTYNTTDSEIDEMSEDEFEELMEALAGAPQAATGRFIDVDCIPVKNKSNEDAKAVRFFAVPEQD